MLFHQLRLERAGTIQRRFELNLAAGALHRLFGFAVTAVAASVLGQVRVELAFQRRLSQLFHQRCQNTVLAASQLARLNRSQAFFKIEFLVHWSILFLLDHRIDTGFLPLPR